MRPFVAPGTPAPARIQRMCIYQWAGARAPVMEALPTAGIEMEIETALLPFAEQDSVSPDGLAEIRQRTRASIDALPRLPESLRSAAPVTLGFVDLAPTAFGAIPTSAAPHARTVALLGHVLSCPASDGPCLTTLAFARATSEGAGTGARSELAEGILAMLDLATARAPSRPLVINLSMGWEPTAECARADGAAIAVDPRTAFIRCPTDYEPRLSLGAETVHYALSRAACRGALVIAAAGNDRGHEPKLRGPSLPGAWESLPRPSAAACAALGVDGTPAAAGDYRPLLHSAGGIMANGHRLSVSRPDGQPRLVAAAAQALLYRDGEEAAASRAPTGTSCAAALVSGVAASVWAAAPGLSAAEVMDIVYSTAADLQRPAEYCLGQTPCPDQRRVSFCRALRAVTPVDCPERTATFH